MKTSIDIERYKELVQSERLLKALQAGGVKYWEGYYDILEKYRETIEIEEIRDRFVADIMEVVLDDSSFYEARVSKIKEIFKMYQMGSPT